MSFRKEEKLLINPNQVFEFKKWMNSKGFTRLYNRRAVNSLYFENISNKMFLDSEEGTVPRKKIRIRNYPDENIECDYFLEIKISSAEGRFKDSKKINILNFNNYIKNGYSDKFYGVCIPRLQINYLREYYKFNDIRITIDQKIAYTDFNNINLFYKDELNAVEVKSNFNKSVDELYSVLPFQRIRFSKYCRGFNFLYNR